MQCITTTTFSMILNGKTCNTFQPERRIRQGDPIYVFRIAGKMNSICVKLGPIKHRY